MRMTQRNGIVTVVLSRRNLEILLSKLNRPDSARTIVCGSAPLIIKVENNDEHYQGREPGIMHPKDEEAIRAQDNQNYDY